MAMDSTAVTPRAVTVARAKPRLLYIDNVRMVLITLVVAGHLAVTYGVIGDWYYKEKGPTSDIFMFVAIPLGAILTASLLGLFALIAGYFTPRAYDRKGGVALFARSGEAPAYSTCDI